ncbi:MAG TPA: alpha-hydroxy acid oxidase [Actinomycetota bacterium]
MNDVRTPVPPEGPIEPVDVPPVVSIDEYEAVARERIPGMSFDYYAGGSGEEWTLRENRAAFHRWVLRPRVLVDVADRDVSTTVLGTPVAFPILAAPTAMQRMAHPDGELATSRACAGAGTVMVLSTIASSTIEDVAAAAPDSPRWFQLYVHRDRGLTGELVGRAVEAGFRALVLTVDTPVLGVRDRDSRNRFATPSGIGLANVGAEFLPEVAAGDSGLAAYVRTQQDPSVTWKDLEWLRSLSDLPIVLKGILTAEDAALAAEAEVDGIAVSNHGGRQLDGSIATLDALPEVVDASGPCEVYLDGGVRRGSDVLKALALGARAVMVGRPVLWGLAAAGQAGVRHVLRLLAEDFDVCMAIAGCRSIDDIRPELVRRAPA